jgi:predicted Fe-Mo cluster-binding NifX family protein
LTGYCKMQDPRFRVCSKMPHFQNHDWWNWNNQQRNRLYPHLYLSMRAHWHVHCVFQPGMRVAIPFWQGRVSPVFDEASRILLIDISQNREQRREERYLADQNPFERARLLEKLGVDLLICGMISQTQQAAINSSGLRIIPHICGSTEDVVTALLENRVECSELRMPGCGQNNKTRRYPHRQ